MRNHLHNEREIRKLAEEAVRKDPDSPALYLHAVWWACIREMRESYREGKAALQETPPDKARANVALAKNRRAHDAFQLREDALSRELGIKWADQ